jgi:hypothetical protein
LFQRNSGNILPPLSLNRLPFLISLQSGNSTPTIKQLAVIASPIVKVVLGRKYDITEWLGNVYQSICGRPNALSLDAWMMLCRSHPCVKRFYVMAFAQNNPDICREVINGLDNCPFQGGKVQLFRCSLNNDGLMPDRRDWEVEQPVKLSCGLATLFVLDGL